MKAALSIFAFYLLALSLVPCSDGGMDLADIASALFGIEHINTSDHEEHSNDCGDDTCSTFCICSCCSMALNVQEKSSFQLKAPALVPRTTPSFVASLNPDPSFDSIWQPPRLA
jgi:hypothetical protein